MTTYKQIFGKGHIYGIFIDGFSEKGQNIPVLSINAHCELLISDPLTNS